MIARLRTDWLTWTICIVFCAASESVTRRDSLRLTWLTNSSLTCNDGTYAGLLLMLPGYCSASGMFTDARVDCFYTTMRKRCTSLGRRLWTTSNTILSVFTNRYYFRRGTNIQHWVLYLEGGGYCWDTASCNARWRRRPGLMSSTRWPRARRAPAVLSADPVINPLWHTSNHVLLPYCSSDMWAGTRIEPRVNSNFTFVGRLIVRSVLTDLLQIGLAGRLLLIGSSAGGTGVMLNADAARRALRPYGVRVAAIADSGWFLDRPAKAKRSSSTDAVARLGHSFWRGSPPTSCMREYPDKPWLCYFGYRLYPHIRTPLFVFQYLFDSAQLTAEGVRAPRTRAQWDAVHQTGAALRSSLKTVRATFAPACIAHGALARPEWLAINVSGVPLPRAISCWERRFEVGGNQGRVRCAPRRLIERCSWPQCNGSCPRLRDPRTGEEVALAALLQSFGLDVRGAAAAMGLDARQLARMSRAELLPLLAPHT